MSTSTEQRTESSTSQTRDPYGRSKPLLNRLIAGATNISRRPGMFEQNFGADTQQAFTMGRDIAGQTQPALGYGIDEITATARGDNLNGNPYYQQALDNSLNRVQDRVNQNFSAAGRYGSGAHTGTLTDRLAQAEVAAMRDNYNFERGNQINAANQGVNLGLQGMGVMDAIGQRQDAQQFANQQAPLQAMQAASGLGVPIANMFGTTTGMSTGTSVQETPMNIPGMIIGGLTTAAGMATGNPMMMASGISSAAGGMSGGGQSQMGYGYQPISGANGLFW